MFDLGSQEAVLSSSRFAVVGRLSESDLGTVYEAVDRERHGRVALKVLRQMGPEQVQRFKGEFRKLQELHHPNLVTLGELVEEGGQWFLTMELVHGCDFLQYVHGYGGTAEADCAASGPQGWSESKEERLRKALGQLALGLHALHRGGKVHRDIKPSNILVTQGDRVVLLDFGILSDLEAEEDWGRSRMAGTASYMAPEQARGEPPSPAADWYSMGVVLYRSLTGQLPFLGSSREVLALKQREEAPPPQALVPGLPKDLCELCVGLLRRDPSERPCGEQVLELLGVERVARKEAWGLLTLPFMGRSTELGALHQALEDSRTGASVVVQVEGESGVGKTRLLKRFHEEAAAHHPDAVVLTGRCYERESVPYKGVDGLVDSLVHYLVRRGRSAVGHVLPREVCSLAQLFPVLHRVPGVARHGSAAVPADSRALRLAALGALRELLERLAALHPLILLLDDVQWANRDSLLVLDELLQARGLLLVVTLRLTAEVPASRPWPQARVLTLEGLEPEEAQGLVRRLRSGHAALPEAEARRIAQESGGHPLFIEALARHQGLEEQTAAQPSLEAALWTRVQRLETRAQRLLELLSVVDGPSSNEVAMRAMAAEPLEHARLTASLRSARLAITSGPASTDTLEVLHDKVRQAVLPHLSEVERQDWHLRIASALEEFAPGSAEMLAHHWHKAGHVERAVHYYLQAAREAATALAFSHEAHLYRTALELGTWETEDRLRLLVAQAEALAHAGRCAEAAQVFLEATDKADSGEALALRRRAAEQYLEGGHMDRALGLLREVLGSVGLRYPKTPRAAVSALALRQLELRLRGLRFQLREASELPAELLEQLSVLASLSRCLCTVDLPRALLFQCRYLLLALRAGEPRHLSQALRYEVQAQSLAGQHNRARIDKTLQVLASLAERFPDDLAVQTSTAVALTMRYFLMGDLAATWPHFQRAAALLQRMQDVYGDMMQLWRIGSLSMCMRGELREWGRQRLLLKVEARERNDIHWLILLDTNHSILPLLAADAPEQARQEADAAIARWTQQQGMQLQHFEHQVAHIYVDLYQGRPEVALERLSQVWPGLESSKLLRFPFTRGYALSQRVVVTLAVAARRSGGEAEALWRAVEADAAQLLGMDLTYYRARAELALAALAAARGAPDAQALYEHASSALESCGLWLPAMAARQRLGELQGGSQGQRLVEQAREWMRERGILRPDALSTVFAPDMRSTSPSP